MKTVSISPFAERHSSYWFNAGFNETYNTGGCGVESAEVVTPVVLDWIARNAKNDDWFLHVNYWDAHTPYRAPQAFGNPFENDPIPGWLTQDVLNEHKKAVGPHGCREISMYSNATDPKYPRALGEVTNMDDLKTFIDGYDCGIRYMDQHIGLLIDALKAQGVYDDLAIIISADHGENMGELAIYAEHATADYSTTRTPMIIKWDGVTHDSADDGLHYSLDLLPTLSDLMGQKACEGWDGKSYIDTLQNGQDTGRDYLVVSQCAHVLQRGVRYQDYMYIRTYHDGYHLWDDEMLFDIKSDPHEQHNLIVEKPEVAGKCARLLSTWHEEMMKTSTCQIDPLWTVYHEGGPLHTRGQLEGYFDFLEKTDRGWAIDELKKKHPNAY